ncbi:MAG: rod shape-determining protein MreD [Fidelibacterota bacterium]
MNKIIRYVILFFVLIFVQTLLPSIVIFHSSLTFDLFLIFLTIIALQIPSFAAIILGFLIGLMQDLTTQQNLLGSFSFMKSISGYTINSLVRFDKIWNKWIRYLFIFACYFIHYTIYYYIQFSGDSGEFLNGLILVITHSILNLFLLWFTDRFVFDRTLV